MLFSTFVFIQVSTLLAVNAVTLGERGADNYVQHSSGSASFTMYSGCANTGDDKLLALL
jgi:hypothetical protein